mmetsp:Transcript_26710/g.41444  ORF Transcript_26710/g.41444 Transcript_26710/m.41444 type:complete len:103 (-) Transcript_26710:1628-1936(-)
MIGESRWSTSRSLCVTTYSGIFRRCTQNSQPEEALSRSLRTEPSEEAKISTDARSRSHNTGNEAALMGRLPTIALKADGWSAVECFKKDRKSCHESVFISGG